MFKRYILRIVGEMLMDPSVQDEIFHALEAEARRTTSKLDDQALEVFKALFAIVIPRLVRGQP